jgi:hypothetical protein
VVAGDAFGPPSPYKMESYTCLMMKALANTLRILEPNSWRRLMVAPSMTSSARPNNIMKLVFFIINIIMSILLLGLDTSTIRGTLLQIQRGDASSFWYGGWST